ncbi:RNA-guided endonuclease InsQ/TnpB family protein [Vibrio breoganii]
MTQRPLSVSLPRFATHTTAEEAIKGAKVVATKKIRFYPENKQGYEEALALYRRSYNIAVELINNGKDFVDGKKFDIRPQIRSQVAAEQEENGRIYNNELPNEAVREATDKLKAVIKKNKSLAKQGAKSGYASLGFKSRKGVVHTFNFPKFPKGKNIAIKALGRVTLTEELPAECFMKACKVTRDKGRWFLQVQQLIDIKPEIQGDVNVVAIDPGVRTFATAFSPNEALVIGDGFAQEKLFPLMKKVDNLISMEQKIINKVRGLEGEPQWAKERLIHLEREINRLKCRKDDLITDLHNRTAFELVNRYDVIFLPTFETKGMVRRKGSKVRTIRRNTCRQMLDLNHYGFKQKLKWMAKKHGKMVVDVNEAYTSKTQTWDGQINPKLKGQKTLKNGNLRIDRDINGSRNVLIKSLQGSLDLEHNITANVAIGAL